MIPKLYFSSEQEKIDYVMHCELDFEQRLDAVVKTICDKEDLKYLALSGPTCSGKTTAAIKLVSEFAERNRAVKLISLDDFFRDRTELEKEALKENRNVDFDSEKALDIELLHEFIDTLQSGKAAKLPSFNFKTGRRESYTDFCPRDTDIIIFEGIQAIYPVFTDTLPHTNVSSLMINVSDSLIINGYQIPPREVRLWRRLVRDSRFRGASPEFTFLLWESVSENEDLNIMPYLDKPDQKINSLLGYEPCMIKEPLKQILSPIGKDSKYYHKSRDILSLISDIDSISEDYLPKNSLYREFL